MTSTTVRINLRGFTRPGLGRYVPAALENSANSDKDMGMDQTDKGPGRMDHSRSVPGAVLQVLGDGCYSKPNQVTQTPCSPTIMTVSCPCPIRPSVCGGYWGCANDLLMSLLIPLASWVDGMTLGAWEADPFCSHHSRWSCPEGGGPSSIQGFMSSILCLKCPHQLS